ncbi:ABC transporter substrate-binding protein [Mastigocoleus sp. MO_188.B34]|uniref:ABC transporter substrate-binding protein n=1 Tax=Mastigocoleus sp. MO_188.B34 TaxID=3036635 RepID=UPI00262F815A|nr:ABC transporter substrate-binding protein [Mastigocoleus sp. MO_188.B34]MDJ0696130.1 ABC transporter substrate-binding protein [Mastigocoleus sp. MO_188.B34]
MIRIITRVNIFRRLRLPAILAVVAALVITACNPANFRSSAAQVSQLVLAASTDPKTFNYALIQESPNVSSFTYEGLATSNGITKEIEPGLAESWEMSEDSLRYVFTLRSGLKWSDGKPLTADDVIFSFNDIYMNKRIPTYNQDGLKIGVSKAFPEVRKLDDRRVEFVLPEPYAPFLRTIAAGIAIMPEHVLRKTVETNQSNGRPEFLSTWGVGTDPKKIIVNGPYTIDSYTPNERIIFRRNPYYWRKDAQGNQQPYIERIVWQIVESGETALMQFRSGGLDFIEIASRNFRLLKREEKKGNFTIYNAGPDSGTTFLTFNLNKGSRKGKPLVDPIKSRWFNNVAFRQAVAYALDRQAIINNTLRGLGKTQNSPVSVPSPYFLSPEEGLKVYDYNPQKAKEILLKAGFKYNSNDQLLDAEGNRVRFTLMGSAGSSRPTVTPKIQQDLGKIGIRVDLQYLDFGVLGDKISNTLDWECWYGAITGGIEPANGYNVWAVDGNFHVFNQKPQAGQAPIEGWEVSDWENKIHQLYIQGGKESDEAKRKAIYAQTQQISQENLPFIHLFNPLALAAARNTIENLKYTSIFPAPANYIWNIYEMKVNKDK